jgi:gliding motility-associated-like protein
MKLILQLLLLSVLISNTSLAQRIFYEDFEGGPTTVFDCTNYYSLNCPHANHYIVTTTLNAGAACLSTAFEASMTNDVSPTGAGYFLFHGTARTGSTVGEVWGTRTPVRVQPNTNYSFSFYLANVFLINVAQIQPFINGAPIAPSVSATSLRTWERFTFCWNSGSATTADLSLVNNMEEASGNDFVFDDIALDVAPLNQRTQNPIICTGQVVQVGNNTYTQTGNYRDVLRAYNGCDSIVLTNLTVSNGIVKSQSLIICSGQILQVGTKNYTQTGVFKDTLRAISGCDSIITTNLTVLPSVLRPQTAAICNGQVFQVGNKTYNQTGIYRDTFRAANGCDSIITTNLTVSNNAQSNNSFTLCNGKSVTFGGKTYSVSGTFRDTFRRVNCDSITVVNINVLPPLSKIQNLTVCQGQIVPVGTKSYSKTGQFRDTLRSFNGCDSIILTNLTVKDISLELGINQTLNFRDSVHLTPTFTGQNLLWKWTPPSFLSCTTCSNPFAKPTATVKYIVQLTDTLAKCTVFDSIQLLVLGGNCSETVFIPNIFSPNDDGANDTFFPYAYPDCIKQVRRMLIFDRWGEQVFKRFNFPPNIKTEGWNGQFKEKKLPPDVFLYIIEMELSDGKTVLYKGDVTLIR